jgi:DHA2 family multidrug resistance protein
MLDQGKDLDWFGSTEIVVLAITALVGFSLFVVWELTDAHPVVDLRLFARRNFWTSSLEMSLAYGAFFGNLVLLPLWLQQYMGYTATEAGIILAPVGLLAILLTPLVGRNINRVDSRILASVAFAVFAVVMYMRAGFTTQADLWTILVPTIIQGAAVSCFFIPLVTITLAGLSPREIPAASGLNNFVRITLGSFGTSISTTLWDHRATLHHAQLAERITAYDPTAVQALQALQSSGMTPEQSHGVLNQMINLQASLMSATDIFRASAYLFAALILVVWLTRPVHGGGRSAEAAGAH